MKGLLKEALTILKNDWRNYRTGILICPVVLFVMERLLGTVCPSVFLLGIPCPACGLTRAALLLLQGKVKESFTMHPLLCVVIAGVVLFTFLRYFLKKGKKIMEIYVAVAIFLFTAYYIYRLKTFFPNREPMIFHKNNLLSIIIRNIVV